MKTVSHAEFNKRLCQLPGHIHPEDLDNPANYALARLHCLICEGIAAKLRAAGIMGATE